MNKESKSEYNKALYKAKKAADPEGFREKMRLKEQRRRADPEQLEKQKRWRRANYAANAEKMRAIANRRYAENINGQRDRVIAYERKRFANRNMSHRLRAALYAARNRSKLRGLEFDLKLADLGEPTHCAVSGVEFDVSKSFLKGNIFVPSLDRIDPSLGYTKGNVRVVCHAFNLAKHTGTDSQVLKLARALVARFGMTD